jgi:CheY-like chemotaxis protein
MSDAVQAWFERAVNVPVANRVSFLESNCPDDAVRAEVLSLLEHDRAFDAVLCDLMMPQLTGMDLYASIKQRDPALAKRFVFMTGGAFTPRARAFIAEVPNTTLEKPFEKGSVLHAVESALREPTSSTG